MALQLDENIRGGFVANYWVIDSITLYKVPVGWDIEARIVLYKSKTDKDNGEQGVGPVETYVIKGYDGPVLTTQQIQTMIYNDLRVKPTSNQLKGETPKFENATEV